MYKIYYQNRKVAETDTIGRYCCQVFIFPNQGNNYFCHKVYFAYSPDSEVNDLLHLIPFKIEKVRHYVDGWDEFGPKYRFTYIKSSLKTLNTLIKKYGDLWGHSRQKDIEEVNK